MFIVCQHSKGKLEKLAQTQEGENAFSLTNFLVEGIFCPFSQTTRKYFMLQFYLLGKSA